MVLIYCDSHTHLSDSAFNTDRDEIIKRSISLGVKYFAEIACEPNYWEKGLLLQKKYPENIFLSLGLHPHNCDKLTSENLEKLKSLCGQKNVSAIGEIGLDYAKSMHAKDLQKQTLVTILNETQNLNKPIILHCRNSFDGKENAYKDLFEILKNRWNAPINKKYGGILHCFSGTYAEAKEAVNMGLLLGINGTITYPKNEHLRETARKIGIKNLITETDCPYLPPQNQRGKRNSPLNIPEIYRALSETLQADTAETATIMVENFCHIFQRCL